MTRLDYLNKNYPVRKTESEKSRFRAYIIDDLKKRGIGARVETSKDGKNNNVVIGDPTSAKTVFTAHYDTPSRSIFPNIMIPKNRPIFYAYQFVPIIFLLIVSFAFAHLIGNVIFKDDGVYYISFMVAYYGLFFGIMRGFKNKYNYNDNTSGVATLLSILDELSGDELNDISFILFDNEEKGKKGSKAYSKDNCDKMKDRFLVNFDCVANGKNIIFIAEKGAVDSDKYKCLSSCFKSDGEYNVEFLTHQQAQSNSDHKNFPMGVACLACQKSKHGLLYTPNIHTHKDTVADNANIDYLAKNAVSFVRKMY